jgi:hypothetical protein
LFGDSLLGPLVKNKFVQKLIVASPEHKADTWNTSATSPDLEEDKPVLDVPSTWPPSESNDHKPVEQEPSHRRIDMPKHAELF